MQISNAAEDTSGITAPVGAEMVSKVTRKFKSKSSYDPDHISYEIIKKAPYIFYNHLAILFTCILILCYVSKRCKIGHVKMLPKPEKSANDPNGYRPITRTSCIYKVFEKNINSRISRFLWHRELMCRYQVSFKKIIML